MNKKQTAIGCTRTQEDCATPSHKHSNEASSLGFLPFFSGTAKIIMNRVNVITLRRGNGAKKIERKEAEEKGSHWPGKELQPAQQEMCTEHSKMNLTGLMCQDNPITVCVLQKWLWADWGPGWQWIWKGDTDTMWGVSKRCDLHSSLPKYRIKLSLGRCWPEPF